MYHVFLCTLKYIYIFFFSTHGASNLKLRSTFSYWAILKHKRGSDKKIFCPRLPCIGRLSPRSLTIPGARVASRVGLHRRPLRRCASGCVRCDPVSLVTLMQPEIYCRWLCADGSTRRRRGRRGRRRRRRWGPRPRLSNGRYRLTWPRRRPRCIPPIDAKHGALPARWREEKLAPSPFLRPSTDFSLDRRQ